MDMNIFFPNGACVFCGYEPTSCLCHAQPEKAYLYINDKGKVFSETFPTIAAARTAAQGIMKAHGAFAPELSEEDNEIFVTL